MSRARKPKQLLALTERRTLLRATWDRARALAPPSRIWVVVPRALKAAVRRELPQLRADRLVVEPSPKDTAPAIALACAAIARVAPEAIAAVLPTDHVIARDAEFRRAVLAAAQAAARGSLVCLGVTPDRAATGFGYLEVASRPRAGVAMPVQRFVEKPDAARARKFLASRRYLWNGGMFVWTVRRFAEELDRLAPRVAAAVRRGVPEPSWSRLEKISVDYAVMEKARQVQVVPLDAGWDDVGSWDAAARLVPAAGATGRSRVLLGSDGSVVFGGARFVAVVGVPGIVVVDTPDALLIVSRDAGEAMREVVGAVRGAGREDLL
jgi:mannose-1-phosphate guanylyltransferase/mannose-6-phosphate isomerase